MSPELTYALVRSQESRALTVVAEERIDALAELMGSKLSTVATFKGDILLSTTYACLFSSEPSLVAARPIIPADYVTATTGTGLVHTSPAHGVEDWEAWRAYQTADGTDPSSLPDVVCAVDAEGKLSTELHKLVEPHIVERLLGKDILSDGTGAVIELLQENGRLIKEVEVQHKFPYDWRTKKPVIFRYVAVASASG